MSNYFWKKVTCVKMAKIPGKWNKDYHHFLIKSQATGQTRYITYLTRYITYLVHITYQRDFLKLYCTGSAQTVVYVDKRFGMLRSHLGQSDIQLISLLYSLAMLMISLFAKHEKFGKTVPFVSKIKSEVKRR